MIDEKVETYNPAQDGEYDEFICKENLSWGTAFPFNKDYLQVSHKSCNYKKSCCKNVLVT